MRAGKLTVLSTAHAAVDFACAALFFGFLKDTEAGWLSMVVYNAFAFMFQLPIGIFADRLNRNTLLAALGCALVACAFPLVKMPVLAAVVAGIGNGAFHVGGGLEVMKGSGDKAGPLGVFVSPGAVGLFLGKFFSAYLSGAWFIPVLAAAAFAGLILLLKSERGFVSENAPVSFKTGRGGAFALAMLFLVVVLRSFLGTTNAFSTTLLEGASPLIAGLVPVLLLALGKAAGGFAADLVGPRLTSLVSLGVCALLLFFPVTPVFALIALFLFNMTMPITLHEAKRTLPGLKGGAFGLLTFALYLGCIPAFIGLETPASPIFFGGSALVSLALLMLGLGRKRA